MRNLLFISCFFTVIGINAQSVPNPGFEFWNTSSIDNPTDYPLNSNQMANILGLPFNCNKIADPQQGALAMQLNTVSNANDTLIGYFFNGDPNTLTGGIPYSGHPITLTGYYKNNQMPGDTGILLIVFKEGGTAISFDFAIFTGTHTAYTPFTVVLTIPPFANPDSIIFGAASSNGFNTNGIPGSMLQFDNITFTLTPTQPANMNGSFENWITTNTSTPQDWATAGGFTFQTTDVHAGTYALSLSTFAYDPQNFSPSYASNGTITSNGLSGGRPYTLLNDTLCGWYKFTAMGIDSGIAFVQTSLATSPVGMAFQILPPNSAYTYFSIPFSSFTQPDTLLVVIASSSNNTTLSNVGSVLKIDDLYLKSSQVGITELSWNIFGMVKLYPNPSNVNCWIEFDNTKNAPVVMTITDGLGKVISEISVEETGHQRQNIDTSVLNKGCYLVTLTQNGKSTCRPLLVD